MNFYDKTTGRWFRYDARCSACWLNHSHTFEKHLEDIALDVTWGSVPGPWTHPDSAENVAKRQAWIKENRSSLQRWSGNE